MPAFNLLLPCACGSFMPSGPIRFGGLLIAAGRPSYIGAPVLLSLRLPQLILPSCISAASAPHMGSVASFRCPALPNAPSGTNTPAARAFVSPACRRSLCLQRPTAPRTPLFSTTPHLFRHLTHSGPSLTPHRIHPAMPR